MALRFSQVLVLYLDVFAVYERVILNSWIPGFLVAIFALAQILRGAVAL